MKQLADGSITPIGPPASSGPFQVTKVEIDANTVSLTFPSVPGASYAGETSDDMVQWLEFEDITAEGPETVLQQSNVADTVRQRYYRIIRTD